MFVLSSDYKAMDRGEFPIFKTCKYDSCQALRSVQYKICDQDAMTKNIN